MGGGEGDQEGGGWRRGWRGRARVRAGWVEGGVGMVGEGEGEGVG